MKKCRYPFCNKSWLICICLSLLISSLAGCAITKRDRYDVPVVPLPAQYKNASVEISVPTDAKPAKSEAPLDPVLVEWWHSLGSTELDELINRGLVNNPDVRIATLRIVQAKARAEQAVAVKGPTIAVPVQASEQFPYYGVGGPTAQGVNINGPKGEKVRQLFQASIRGDWRVDMWGELDSLAESSSLQLWRASFERDNVQATTAANITSSYVEYLSLNDRIRVARETETVLSGMVASVEERMEKGEATAIDLEQQRAAVYAARATIPVLEQQRDDALGTIAFLLGTVPESLKLSDSGLDSLALPSIMPGVPSSLLLRRPDVRMVEARLLAADADIDVARARILPPLDLTAQVGYGSYYLSELFKPQALFWSAIANLSVTIFDGGKLSREKDYAQAVHEEMVETYVRTIYQAVREVESSLNAIRQTGKRLDAQKASADAARRAWDFSSEVYAAGAIDYLALLDTERTYHQNLDEYHRIRMDRYRALINLFHALGGGVPQGGTLPGKGERPALSADSNGGAIIGTSEERIPSVKDEDWMDNQPDEKGDCWLVELPGVYHRTAIATAWRDLRVRFPGLMENRFLRPNLKGKMEDSADNRVSWYQLYVSRFSTFADAEEMCMALRASHQRCRVVLSQQGNIIATAFPLLCMSNTLNASSEAGTKHASASHQKSTAMHSNNIKIPPLQLALANVIESSAANTKTSGLGNSEIETTIPEQPKPEGDANVSGQARLKAEPQSIEQDDGVALFRDVSPGLETTRPVAKTPSAYGTGLQDSKPECDGQGTRQVYAVQLGAYRSSSSAARDAAFWRAKGYKTYIRQFSGSDGKVWFKNSVGEFLQRSEADALAVSISRKDGARAIVVPVTMECNSGLGRIDIHEPGMG